MSLGAPPSATFCERIRFNLHPPPAGHYTIIVEFSPDLQNASVTAAIGAGSITTQTSIVVQPRGSIAGYIKILVQLNNGRTGLGTDYIYFDLHGKIKVRGEIEFNEVHLIVYGVHGIVSKVPPSVFDQVFHVDDSSGTMVLHTNLDFHGHRLVNNGQSGFSFYSGGVISLHDDLNRNNYRVVGRDGGGGFEIEDGKIKVHEEINLNGHGLSRTLTFSSGNIVLRKDVNLNTHRILGGPYIF